MKNDWFNKGLPLNVEIHGLDCKAYDTDDAAKNWNYADFVRCVNCHKYGYIELGANQCPACGCTGCLMDIQESDVSEVTTNGNN